jgi:hypothetical protein
MDWTKFVELVSVTRLEILAILLAATIVLGILGAIKSRQFKWVQIAAFLVPGETAFWYIIGYVIAAGMAFLFIPDGADPTAVVSAYTVATGAICLKLKEQAAFLVPGLPVVNWKLPLETKVE